VNPRPCKKKILGLIPRRWPGFYYIAQNFPKILFLNEPSACDPAKLDLKELNSWHTSSRFLFKLQMENVLILFVVDGNTVNREQ